MSDPQTSPVAADILPKEPTNIVPQEDDTDDEEVENKPVSTAVALGTAAEDIEAAKVAVKKKLGRPKGSKNKPKLTASEPVKTATATAKKKPGRPKGSKNKPKLAAAVVETKPVKAVKVKKAKAVKEAKVEGPTTGQSAPEIPNLDFSDLNDKEKKVLSVYDPSVEPRQIKSISELAKGAWPTKITKKQANSWTRNSLRRLVRANLLAKLKRGSYQLTVKGRNRLDKGE